MINEKMTEMEIGRWARRIAQRLLFVQMGGMDAPETWASVAARRGHEVEHFHDPAAGPGEYASCEAGTGVIRINTAYAPGVQARACVHELAHAELNTCSSGLWRADAPGDFAGDTAPSSTRSFLMGYDDEPGDVRHKIARRVEEMCFRRL